MMETIGFLELNSIAKGVEVADIVLKTAAVDLVFSRSGCPGKYYLLFTGEVAALTETQLSEHMIGRQLKLMNRDTAKNYNKPSLQVEHVDMQKKSNDFAWLSKKNTEIAVNLLKNL